MTTRHNTRHLPPLAAALLLSTLHPFSHSTLCQNAAEARAEHAAIGVNENTKLLEHTTHPGAQWFPDAAFGLFLHWDTSSVRAMNISWPMIPGRPLAAKEITDPAERARIIRDNDYNLDGKPNPITPDEYFTMAAQFNPRRYDPDKWASAAKAAGITYVVLTTRHHGGFALWPSATGDYDTKNHMGGRDLLKPYVEALRRHGLKVGFYYSPPDWHFDRDYKDFLYHGAVRRNPWLPPLGPDLKPRSTTRTPAQIAAHQAAYVAHVNNQIEELLTRYGRIDLLWFDGKPDVSPAALRSLITPARIRELQPGIVFNPRLFGTGDFATFERTLPATRPDINWAEFCNTWTSNWSHVDTQPFRATGYILGQLAQSRAWGINYLVGVGPTRDGELVPEIYTNLATVAKWMKTNAPAIRARPLPQNETSTHFATASVKDGHRYLFALPAFSNPRAPYPENQLPPADETLTLSGIPRPARVTLLATKKTLAHTYDDTTRTLTIPLPAAHRTPLVDVVHVQLPTP